MPRCHIAGPYSSSLFSFLRILHTGFHSDPISLPSHQPWGRVPLAASPPAVGVSCLLLWLNYRNPLVSAPHHWDYRSTPLHPVLKKYVSNLGLHVCAASPQCWGNLPWPRLCPLVYSLNNYILYIFAFKIYTCFFYIQLLLLYFHYY